MRDKVSVAMATYNGEKYIKDQLDSILIQLNADDEIIISDDGSTDKTKDIIKSLKDKRIKVIDGPRKGVKQNFANALKKTTGTYIFLSDQDDVWNPNKVDSIVKIFEKNPECVCVLHDCIVVDEKCEKIIIPSFFNFRLSKKGVLKNIYKNSYIGCCMAIRKDLKEYILPIPNNIEMHDQWIGIISELVGKTVFSKQKLIKYRRHENNVSGLSHYGIIKMIKNRILFIKEIFAFYVTKNKLLRN